jgi:hypothetical protein
MKNAVSGGLTMRTDLGSLLIWKDEPILVSESTIVLGQKTFLVEPESPSAIGNSRIAAFLKKPVIGGSGQMCNNHDHKYMPTVVKDGEMKLECKVCPFKGTFIQVGTSWVAKK